MPSYRVLRAAETDLDLALLAEFLFAAYRDFGEDAGTAMSRTEARLDGVERFMLSLGEFPHRGTLRPEILPGLRSLTRERVVLYFDVDDGAREVRILGVFFGGRDHHRAMLARLAERR